MKNKFIYLAYGFFLINIWSLSFMYKGTSDGYTAALGLSFTFLSVYFLQKARDFSLGVSDKAVILLFPVLYAVGAYASLAGFGFFNTRKRNLYQLLFYIHLLNPINIALLVLVLGLTKLKDLSKPANLFIFIYLTLFYAYIFHKEWMVAWAGVPLKSFDTEKSDSPAILGATAPVLDSTFNLSQFSFIGPQLDSAALPLRGDKFVLIETWNENCLPCIKAMGELPNFYDAVQDRLDVYYVYESHKARERQMFDQIFHFQHIHDKSKIRVDINQSLYDSVGMEGFPYFLLFSPTGKLVYQCRGYGGKYSLTQQIMERIQRE